MFKNVSIKLARLQLKSRAPSRRCRAIRTLSKFNNDPSIRVDLQNALLDSEWAIRDAAIRALRPFPLSPGMKPTLIHIITTEPNWAIRSQALDLLQDDPDPLLIPAFIQAAQSDDVWIAIEAIAILGKRKDPSVLPALLSALHASAHGDSYDDARARQADRPLSDAHEDLRSRVAEAEGMAQWEMDIADLRATAAQALGALGDTAAVPDLIRALYDTHPTAIPEAAAQALEQIGTDEAQTGLSAWRDRSIE